MPGTFRKAVSSTWAMPWWLASAGTPPVAAQEPKATNTWDFRRNSSHISRFSSVLSAPLKRVRKISPSASASMSFFFVSRRQGQNMKSKTASTSRIASWILARAISQPPQEAAQYIASFGFCVVIGVAPWLCPLNSV